MKSVHVKNTKHFIPQIKMSSLTLSSILVEIYACFARAVNAAGAEHVYVDLAWIRVFGSRDNMDLQLFQHARSRTGATQRY
jgi:hypothetical protein